MNTLFHFFSFQVHSLLQQMQDRFQTMSDQILNRIDDMGSRIDDLEKNLDDLITNAGLPNPSNTAAISAEDGGSQNEPRQGE